MAELGINADSVCFIIVKSREFEAQSDVVEDDPGSNPTDDGFRSVLVAYPDDSTYDEVKQFIDALDLDGQCELVALAWLGRGDFDVEEWQEARGLAQERHTEQTAEYLLGMPLLADYLQEGLGKLGFYCDGVEVEHL
jgi:hypothetical protein